MVFVSFSIRENPNSSGVTDKHHRLSNEPPLHLNIPLIPRDAYAYLPTADYFSLCPALLVMDKSYDSYTHIIASPYTEVRVNRAIP